MNRKRKSFKIAMGGICLALAVISLLGASFVPGIELTLFALSSLFTAVMIIETGIGGGLSVFAGAGILGFILMPNKLAMIPYIFLFGYYPVLKFFIEKINSGAVQVMVKVIFFAAALSAGMLLFKEILAESINLPDYPAAVLIIAGTLFMLLYDFVLTFLINRYMRHIKGGSESSMKLS